MNALTLLMAADAEGAAAPLGQDSQSHWAFLLISLPTNSPWMNKP